MSDIFTDDELLRYSRHILLPQIDVEGQQALKASRVLVVGAGGLGSPVGLYLASAGVGHITVVDADNVELSNLQRQIAHPMAHIGLNKAQSLKHAMERINPQISVTVVDEWLTEVNADELIANVDVVLDCCDNFATRYLVNRVCVTHKKALVSGAAIRGEGQIVVLNHHDQAPCYSCLYPEGVEEGETCAQAGVLAPLVGVIGSLQAVEALKYLTSKTTSKSVFTVYDAFHGQFRHMHIAKDKACAICGQETSGANG